MPYFNYPGSSSIFPAVPIHDSHKYTQITCDGWFIKDLVLLNTFAHAADVSQGMSLFEVVLLRGELILLVVTCNFTQHILASTWTL